MKTRSQAPSRLFVALILGLAICPWAYVLLGALDHFSETLVLIMLPAVVLATALLFLHYSLGFPALPWVWLHHPLQLLCWLVISSSVLVLSNFTLFTVTEQVGLFCLLHLATSVLCMPLVVLKTTSLQHWAQTSAWPGLFALAFVGLELVLATNYILAPSQIL